jgi:hypothetical protein
VDGLGITYKGWSILGSEYWNMLIISCLEFKEVLNLIMLREGNLSKDIDEVRDDWN